MLGVKLGNQPTAVPGVPTLHAMNIDPEAAAEAYRERVIAPYRGNKSDQEIQTIREQLSGACTTEIAAFDEFAGLIGGADATAYEHVIFDTAPTGHTLRLLSLPLAWTHFLDTNTRGASCLGPHSGLTMHHDRFAAALSALSDPAHTTVVLVARADVAALREADRSSRELRDLGIQNQQLVINAVFHALDRQDAVALAFERKGMLALNKCRKGFGPSLDFEVPLKGYNLVGLDALRGLSRRQAQRVSRIARHRPPLGIAAVSVLIDELAASPHALVMVMGKGGVGKTTIAAAIAVELAKRGIPVHLSTTDPAAHLANTVVGQVERLQVIPHRPRR